MNWKQIYNLSTQDERYQIIEHMLSVLESRQQRVVFTGNRWIRNRRRGYQAHFLNNRRGRHTRARAVSLVTFVVVLVTVSAATIGALRLTPINISLPYLFFYATSVLSVVMFKPRIRNNK